MKKENSRTDILKMALKDFSALEGMEKDVEHFSDEIFGFHAEQAVEKALKSWISLHGLDYPFTHDLSLLLNTLQKTGVDISEWIGFLELGSFGVQFRYEALDFTDEPLDRKAIILRVGQLINKIQELLS